MPAICFQNVSLLSISLLLGIIMTNDLFPLQQAGWDYNPPQGKVSTDSRMLFAALCLFMKQITPKLPFSYRP